MMRRFMISCLALTFLVSPIVFGADIEIALEAELANTIQAPLVVAEDELASNGKFIWVEGAPVASGKDNQGWAEYIINIPEKGKYALWGYVIAWDGNSDSFWVTWQPADPDEDPQSTQNTEFRWAVAQGAAWHWDRINQWLDAGTFDREWEFDQAGETVLRIGNREDATMLDAIFVTSNVGATTDVDANVRLPTDKDREEQSKGLAVTPKDKMATAWGKVKNLYR